MLARVIRHWWRALDNTSFPHASRYFWSQPSSRQNFVIHLGSPLSIRITLSRMPGKARLHIYSPYAHMFNKLTSLSLFCISFTRTSTSISQSLLDPVVLSGTQQLKRGQIQNLESGSETLALPEGSTATMTQIMQTQEMPSTSTLTQFGQTSSWNLSRSQKPFLGSPGIAKSHKESKPIEFKNASKLSWAEIVW